MNRFVAGMLGVGMLLAFTWGEAATRAVSSEESNRTAAQEFDHRNESSKALIAQTQGDIPTYTTVASIFKQHCTTCHAGPKPPEGLRLDTYAGIMAGAKKPVVIPGDPVKSDIVRAIRGTSKPRMPLNRPPLSETEITLIEKWIKAGAPEGNSA
jgi:uncharacterized membrane protein